MRDAVVMQSGLVAATLMSVALLPVPHGESAAVPVIALPLPPPLTKTDRALELACARFGDAPCSFELVQVLTHGDRTGVFVKRSTGGCGGCGAFTVAVMFRGGALESVDKLGEYGRFGNGPAAIRFLDVVGHLVLEVDDTISMGGYSDTTREYFAVEQRVERELCLQIAGSDDGARDNWSAWSGSPWVAAEGTFYFSPGYSKRGEVTPQLYAFSFPFEHGRWTTYGINAAGCIDPADL